MKEHHVKYLTELFQDIPLNLLPKAFKGLLVDTFSILNQQERPEVPIEGKKLFYKSYYRKIRTFLCGLGRRRTVEISWDLMQCKAFAKEADPSFVKDELLKHKRTVTTNCIVSDEIMEEFSRFIEPWVQEFKKIHPHQKTSLASNHASYEHPRSAGGISASYPIVSSELGFQPSSPRLEPTTICLHGLPGCGKSLIQNQVIRKLSNLLGKSFNETSYYRNEVCDHWDGYSHQPLVVYDDFLQFGIVNNKSNSADLPGSFNEFITLNSSATLVLPMADLRDKGTEFNSPLILYSTNADVDRTVRRLSYAALSPEAIARRFQYNIVFPGMPYGAGLRPVTHVTIFDNNGQVFRVLKDDDPNAIAECIVQLFLDSWKRKSHFYLKKVDVEELLPIEGLTDQYYQSLPIGHNRVKVVPLVEPLKIRTITVGTASNFGLKSLQKSMFQSLKPFKAFAPCFSPEYQEHLLSLSKRDGLWLSGDYSSATDGVSPQFVRRVIDDLLPYMSNYERKLALRETQPHICEYPEKYDIPSCIQTNGQLMGSLLSFPVLSLVNAFTAYKATGCELKEIPCLIHGDDLAARFTESEIQTWKDFCPSVGFGLSLGKNYTSPHWVSIDSQVFYGSGLDHLNTGKFSCFSGDDETKVHQLLKRNVPKGLVVSLCKETLRKTPRSIDVSQDFGGLGVEGKPNDPISHSVYLHKLRSRISREEIDGFTRYVLPEKVLAPYFSRYCKGSLPKEYGEKKTSSCSRKLFKLIKDFKEVVPDFPILRPEDTCLVEQVVKGRDDYLDCIFDTLQLDPIGNLHYSELDLL